VSITTVAVRHNFETAHRLPQLGGKCTSLHGHSWWAEVTVAGVPDEAGVVLDFAALKAELREWIDQALDHATMLGAADPLVAPLLAEGCRVFLFGYEGDATRDLSWPTVENVAELLARVTDRILAGLAEGRWLRVERVRVTETHVNAAEVVR
jgi:6-pyruvoyltetrahydropterin/6-carboxytetrahydropterin synthase